MGRIEAPAGGESRRQTATPHPYRYRASFRPYLNGGDEETCQKQRALSLPNGQGGSERHHETVNSTQKPQHVRHNRIRLDPSHLA